MKGDVRPTGEVITWEQKFGDGAIVKYKDVIYPGDENALFLVLEDNGDRLLVSDLNTISVLGSTMCFSTDYFVKA